MAPTILPLATLFLAFSASFLRIGEAETDQLTALKLNSHILQESIAREVNEHPGAGWKAAINPRFSNSTVGQFKRLLGVKQTPKNLLNSIPVVTHPKSSNLPKEFDARTAWPQCSTIGRILGNPIASSPYFLKYNEIMHFAIGADSSFCLLIITLIAEPISSLKIR
ncbi:unnamed protein product [Vicia faba]|uniref:Peptidase C1A propeptide domain-containing protein n=1 Tax=Vicia faba TaxID=3906 RepID=A0AAV1AYQ2_VICFA|nr:unnamed protein product [Vicia faba]